MQVLYAQKLNELELEQEELEYYKKKYKRTVAALSHSNRPIAINRLKTSPPPDSQLQDELAALQAETELLESLKQQLEAEKTKYRRTKNKLSVHRSILNRTSEWNNYASVDLGRKSLSENQIRSRN